MAIIFIMPWIKKQIPIIKDKSILFCLTIHPEVIAPTRVPKAWAKKRDYKMFRLK